MVFTENTFDKCVNSINDINAILFFGSNFGLGTILGDKIKNVFAPEDIIILDYEDLEKNVSMILQEQIANDFFSKKKLIKVYNVKGKILKDIQFLNDKKFNDKLILFFAPEIDGKSGLKIFFEKSNLLVSINCINDDERTATHVINEFCKDNNLKMTTEANNLMCEMLKGDRKALLTELEKIKLFYLNDNNVIVNEDEIEKLIQTYQSFNPFNFVDYILSNNIDKALSEYNLLKEEGTQMIMFVRFFTKSLNDFIDMKKNLQNGMTLEQVLRIKFIFFKRINIVKYILSHITLQKLEQYLQYAFKIEKIAKIYGNDIAIVYFEKIVLLSNKYFIDR